MTMTCYFNNLVKSAVCVVLTRLFIYVTFENNYESK